MTESSIGDHERRSWRLPALIIASAVALGAVGGIIWGLLAPAEQLLVVAADRGAALTGESTHRFDSLALFVCVTAVSGILLPVAWWCRRADRGVVMFAGLFLGGIAATGVAAGVGVWVARIRVPREAEPAVGQVVSLAPGIASPLVFLVAPLITSLVVVLLAALNPHENLYSSPEPDSDELPEGDRSEGPRSEGAEQSEPGGTGGEEDETQWRAGTAQIPGL